MFALIEAAGGSQCLDATGLLERMYHRFREMRENEEGHSVCRDRREADSVSPNMVSSNPWSQVFALGYV